MNLTRHEITTFIGQPTNLGCYATATTLTNSSLTHSWTKDNHTVTQSPSVRAFGDVLVVTPEKVTDFGTYECNITNGVSSTQCRILLLRGLDKPGKWIACAQGHPTDRFGEISVQKAYNSSDIRIKVWSFL